MDYVKDGSDYSLFIEFKPNSELVVPDADSVELTLTKNDGSAITDFDGISVTTDEDTTSVVVSIPANRNTATFDVEVRTAKVTYEVDGKPYKDYYFYTLLPYVDIPVSKDAVRLVLGITVDELEDDQIDLVKAFVDVDAALGDTSLSGVIEAGTSKVWSCLEAVKLRAALNLIPVLQLIAAQSQSADNVEVRRFEEVDFPSLRRKLVGDYSTALRGITGASATIPTFSAVQTGVDPVTGQ